jgi:hypothetical protein
MSKIVITGGAGFIGSHIAENLAKEGHEIVIVDNLDPYYSVDLKKRNLDIVLHSGDATFINADITNLSRMKEIIDRTVDYVYHEAAQAGVRISVLDPFKPNDVNVLGTLIVLALGIGTFLGFSMIGAGILILTKQGDPVTALITIATSLFGNVLFPPQIMPPALQAISYIVPQYYFFTSIRLMLTGSTISMILPDLLILAAECAIIVPLGYGVYAWCLKTARRNGTLSWF